MMRIAVIGGGATGVLVAAQIGRRLRGQRVDVLVIDPAETVGPGLAYSTADPWHLLNVRVANMSAFADDPEHLIGWLRRRGESATPFSFISRRTYGDYVADIGREAIAARDIRHVRDTVVAMREGAAAVALRLASGATLGVDRVVLATGHEVKPAIGGIPAEQPWTPGSLDGLAVEAPILIVGSGLTMVDMALSLERRGHRGPIVSVSRRGLLPHAHRPVTIPRALAAAEVPFGQNLSGLLHWLRALARRFEVDGADWRAAIDVLRPHTQRLWQAMSLEQKRRFLRHARAYWDIHRHRMAPEIETAVAGLRASGRLQIVAGRIVTAKRTLQGVHVEIAERAGERLRTQAFARVIDCTGLANDVTQSPNPLIRSLLAHGVVRPDALDIGLDVGEDFAVIGADGAPSPRILTLGPLARGALWECIAVPDIRLQCRDVAERLAAQCESELGVAFGAAPLKLLVDNVYQHT